MPLPRYFLFLPAMLRHFDVFHDAARCRCFHAYCLLPFDDATPLIAPMLMIAPLRCCFSLSM